MRKSIYNKSEFDSSVEVNKVSRSFEYEPSRTDQSFFQPIQKTVEGFIATGRNVLSLRQPQSDYDYAEGDNIDKKVPGEGTVFKSIYQPDIADVSQAQHVNDAVIGQSIKKIDEATELEQLKKQYNDDKTS